MGGWPWWQLLYWRLASVALAITSRVETDKRVI